MNEDRVRAAIMQISALAPLNPSVRMKIANLFIAHGKPQKIAANTVLYRRGDASDDGGIVILDGELTIDKDGNVPVTAYGPDLLGEMAQINPTRQRTATVTTLTDVHALRFRWPAILQAVAATLSGAEVQSFSDALQQHAWNHFTE